MAKKLASQVLEAPFGGDHPPGRVVRLSESPGSESKKSVTGGRTEEIVAPSGVEEEEMAWPSQGGDGSSMPKARKIFSHMCEHDRGEIG